MPTTLTYRLIYPTYLSDLSTHQDNLLEPTDNLTESTDNLPESTNNLPVFCFTIQTVQFQPNITILTKFQNAGSSADSHFLTFRLYVDFADSADAADALMLLTF